jgi:hypothetical protein
MEHRWGRRFPVNLPVRLTLSSGVVGWGRVRNLSMTGAFLQSALPLPAGRLVALEAMASDVRWPWRSLTASVIWARDGGAGIEWCEPLDSADVRRASARLHSTDVSASLDI